MFLRLHHSVTNHHGQSSTIVLTLAVPSGSLTPSTKKLIGLPCQPPDPSDVTLLAWDLLSRCSRGVYVVSLALIINYEYLVWRFLRLSGPSQDSCSFGWGTKFQLRAYFTQHVHLIQMGELLIVISERYGLGPPVTPVFRCMGVDIVIVCLSPGGGGIPFPRPSFGGLFPPASAIQSFHTGRLVQIL
ncbi:hypothetical protein L1987_60578 [Smallanthus sonchifolius]|uniref:Uncharacterized protein n=1 Tax=Smallanthus sonchifolius TaxID=185202 RepID=A0ACB9D8T5_9ASTR|nr:hypothetical protein L1987_60578 [Smallanthus sonchifolius]